MVSHIKDELRGQMRTYHIPELNYCQPNKPLNTSPHVLHLMTGSIMFNPRPCFAFARPIKERLQACRTNDGIKLLHS